MSCKLANQYAKCIKPLRAEEMQNELAVSAFPHLKPDKAKKLQRDVMRAKTIRTEHKPQSTEDLYHKLLRTLGNG